MPAVNVNICPEIINWALSQTQEDKLGDKLMNNITKWLDGTKKPTFNIRICCIDEYKRSPIIHHCKCPEFIYVQSTVSIFANNTTHHYNNTTYLQLSSNIIESLSSIFTFLIPSIIKL